MKKFVKLSDVKKSRSLNIDEMKNTKAGASLVVMYGIPPYEKYGVPIVEMYGVPISLYAVHDIEYI